ncbi:MAG: hypothetical protein KF911_03505 [Pseudomonadales bacterium]|nr:hypothetical protein [Pseudomonadales bacterium]
MSSVVISSKKKRELDLLVTFARTANLDIRVVESEREAPDFILDFEGRRIGLEVTELFVEGDGRALQPQARTSIGNRIAMRARSRYEHHGGKPLHVSIGLTLGNELRSVNRDQLAEGLAQFLLALDPPLDEFVSWRPCYHNDPLPAEVHYLHILAVPSWSMAHWYVPEAGWVAPLEEAALQAKVHEKAAKLSDYHRAAAEIWLLIAVKGWSASQLFEIRSDLRPERVSSPFARTYYFSAFDGRVLRLGPSA